MDNSTPNSHNNGSLRSHTPGNKNTTPPKPPQNKDSKHKKNIKEHTPQCYQVPNAHHTYQKTRRKEATATTWAAIKK
jgi:hypothetical protein